MFSLYNKKMRNGLVFVLLFVLLFAAFFIRGSVTQDPDFGWHIQAGNNILSNGIPHKDPFSYSMPSYPFVDHEWATNVWWSIVFNAWGMTPLLIGMTFLAVISLLLQTRKLDKKWIGILLFLAGGTLFDFVGVRTQVLSWFFLSVLLCIVYQKQLWDKWRYFLPLLFIIWANSHGGFGIGIGVLGIVLLGKSIEKKERLKESAVLLSLCLLATFINPFGVRLWWEFWMQLSDTQLHWAISEWYPAIYFSNIAFWIYWAISIFLVIRFRKKYTLTELFLYCFFLLAAFSSMRNIPLWIIVSFAMTVKGVSFLYQEAGKHEYGADRFRVAYIFFSFVAFVFFLPQLGGFFYGLYTSRGNVSFYPAAAVGYLHKHVPTQQIFSAYDWGGYLIWQLPEKRVFIDGRMPSWRWQANIPGESNYAFYEYRAVLSGQEAFTPFVEKYHIDTLLVPVSQLAPPDTKLLGFTIEKNNPLHFLLISFKSFYMVVNEAKRAGWKEVYHDQTAVIYEK